MSEVLKCDRCGKMVGLNDTHIIRRNGRSLTDIVRWRNGLGILIKSFEGEWDLCAGCYNDFRKFMDEKREADQGVEL